MSLSGFLQNRVYLLRVIGLVTTVAALGPFFVEEFTPKLAAHATLHIAAITFGVFLSILGMIAYNSTRNTHMVFTTLAFVTFTVLSIFLLYADLNADRIEHEEAVFEDVLLTVMIGFFAMGVFSNQKFKAKKGFN